jgi:uncharacterized membrane protein YhaH (DUF805 family)
MFSANRPDRDDRSHRVGYARRLSRLDFCVSVAAVILSGMALRSMLGPSLMFGSLGLCAYLAQRRLWDIGTPTAKWTPFIAVIFPITFFFVRHNPIALGIWISLLALAALALLVYLLAAPGDPAPNRFGAPPPGAIKLFLAARAVRRSAGS